MEVSQRLADIFRPAMDLVYPPRCPLCGDAIAEQRGLCVSCWNELVIPGEPCCATCQRPFGDVSRMVDPDAQCAPCMASPPRHDGITAATLYNDASRKLILALKHGKRIALAPMMARLIAARLPEFEAGWLLIPVPLHRWRIWQRGFNQAALVAEHIAKQTGSDLLIDGLIRTRQTKPLGGLGKKQREKMLSGAIDLNQAHSERIKGANVLLVDDVLTSGATSDACVTALKRVGAGQVRIACFARVLDELR